jgi:hypothetical protein
VSIRPPIQSPDARRSSQLISGPLGDSMVSLKDFVQLLGLYPLWIRILAPVLIGVAILLLIVFKPQLVDVTKDFQLRPIQSSGENVFHLEDDSPDRQRDPFRVALHFDFWSRHDLEILNVDLRSNPVSASPGRQRVWADATPIPIDASYRLTRKIPLKANSSINFALDREFTSPRGSAEDYPRVIVTLEVSSPVWRGIRTLLFDGQLQLGGKLAIESQKLE